MAHVRTCFKIFSWYNNISFWNLVYSTYSMLAMKHNFRNVQIWYACENLCPITNWYNLSSSFSICPMFTPLGCTGNPLILQSFMNIQTHNIAHLTPKIIISFTRTPVRCVRRGTICATAGFLCARTVLQVCFLAHKSPAKPPSHQQTVCNRLAMVIGGGVLKGPYFFGSDLEGPVLLQSQLVSVF